MIPSQMLKGTLEGCILAIISKKETYGYEISEQLKEYGFGKKMCIRDRFCTMQNTGTHARSYAVPPSFQAFLPAASYDGNGVCRA